MDPIKQTILGLAVLFLLGLLVVVKRIATGSILDRPKGNAIIRLVNSFNLFFLLIVNPLTAVILVIHRLDILNPVRITIGPPWLLMVWEMGGLGLVVTGYGLMMWALSRLAANYQIGGSSPRPKDTMIVQGPYRLIRHPMYTSALTISLGLTGLTQSWAFLAVFLLYLVLILLLIPMEEKGLQKAYRQQYHLYQEKTKKLIPLVY